MQSPVSGDAVENVPSSRPKDAPHPALVLKLPPSEELAGVLTRAAFVGDRLGEVLNISFTTLLLGVMASDTHSSRWFRTFVDKFSLFNRFLLSGGLSPVINSIMVEASQQGGGLPGPGEGRLTASAVKVLQAAEELARVAGWPSGPVQTHHLLAAYIYRCPEGHQEQLTLWGFDKVTWSQEFLRFITEVPELHNRELKRWVEIHREIFKNDPKLPPSPEETGAPAKKEGEGQTLEEPVPPPDVTPLHLDNPADADYLGRRGFAEALAVRLNRVWGECNRPGQRTEARSSFVLHLHGPWGSGKTSLLNFLKKELQPARGERAAAPESRGWVVVDFNAWQHQRISPPWWPLLEAVSKQAAGQLRDDFGEGGHALLLRVREWWWRFSTGRKVYLVTAVIAFVLATLLYVLKNSNIFPEGLTAVFGPANSFVAYASVVVGVWSSVLVVSRSLLSGSARAAQSFMETAGDPMERVCAHFRELLGWVGKPVVVFLDDLDRCQPKYVVELLEGVQTLFSDPRVVYVVAADRRWLNTCFETTYQTFADAVKEPGRRLGSLFLEKAFELSVSVPRLSDEMRQVYWDFLVGGSRRDIERAIRDRSAEAEREFVGTATEAQVLKVLGTAPPVAAGAAGEKRDPLLEQVRRGAAVKQLASTEVVASTEYFLKPFAPLLEPNPRAMKRLVNAYSVLRDMALLAGVDVLGDIDRRRQLALWAIVSLRWPLLEEYLESHPEMIDAIREGKTREGDTTLLDDEHLQKLAESEEVRNVFRGGSTPTGLRREVVSQIVGISAAQPTAASVA